MTKKRIFTHDLIFLRMAEHIIGNFPDNAVVWDVDTVSEHEFGLTGYIHISQGNSHNQTAVIAVSFDKRLLNHIKDKNPNAIVIQRPVSLSDFAALFAPYNFSEPKNYKPSHEKTEESDTKKTDTSPVNVDPDTMTVQLVADRKLKTIQLTAKEFNLFYILYLNKGQTVQRSEIITYINGAAQSTGFDSNDTSESGNIVEVYIHYLRKKLGKKMIASVRGEGYRLDL